MVTRVWGWENTSWHNRAQNHSADSCQRHAHLAANTSNNSFDHSTTYRIASTEPLKHKFQVLPGFSFTVWLPWDVFPIRLYLSCLPGSPSWQSAGTISAYLCHLCFSEYIQYNKGRNCRNLTGFLVCLFVDITSIPIKFVQACVQFCWTPWNMSKTNSNVAEVRLAPKAPVAQRLQQGSTSPKRTWFPGLDKHITTYGSRRKNTRIQIIQANQFSAVQYLGSSGFCLLPGLFGILQKNLLNLIGSTSCTGSPALMEWGHGESPCVQSPLLFEHNSLEIWSLNIFKYFQTESLKLNNAPRLQGAKIMVCMSFACHLLNVCSIWLCNVAMNFTCKNDLFGATWPMRT